MKHRTSLFCYFLSAVATASKIASKISSPTKICAEVHVIYFDHKYQDVTVENNIIKTNIDYVFRVTVQDYHLDFSPVYKFIKYNETWNDKIYTYTKFGGPQIIFSCENLHENVENNGLSLQNPYLSAINNLKIEAISHKDDYNIYTKLKLKLFLMSESEEVDKIPESRKKLYGVNTPYFWLVQDSKRCKVDYSVDVGERSVWEIPYQIRNEFKNDKVSDCLVWMEDLNLNRICDDQFGNVGYHIINGGIECEQNKCTCSNGSPVIGTNKCLENDAEVCEFCDDPYLFDKYSKKCYLKEEIPSGCGNLKFPLAGQTVSNNEDLFGVFHVAQTENCDWVLESRRNDSLIVIKFDDQERYNRRYSISDYFEPEEQMLLINNETLTYSFNGKTVGLKENRVEINWAQNENDPDGYHKDYLDDLIYDGNTKFDDWLDYDMKITYGWKLKWDYFYVCGSKCCSGSGEENHDFPVMFDSENNECNLL